MNRRRSVIASFLFLLFFVGVYLYRSGGEEPKEYRSDQGMIFGTVYHITYEASRPLKDEIEAELKKFDNSLSPFNKQSVITKVNQNDPTVVLDEWFVTVFNKAMEVSAKTDGAFDITVAPIVNAWGFGFKKKEQVTQTLIDSLLPLVGWEKVKLVNGKVIKEDPRILLECAAIAKGYACDVVGNMLARQGCKNYMVEIGGEIACKGISAKGKKWRVGINKPIEVGTTDKNEIEQVVNISNQGMATSGNYRNFYYDGGKRYAHTIDPHTGYPIQHDLLSATVFAPDCMTADAYATAFMVLGHKKAMEIVNADPLLEAYFIYTDDSDQYRISYSNGLEQALKAP